MGPDLIMKFFEPFISRSRELYQSMTPANRLVGGLLLACILVSSVFLVRGTSGTSSEYLFGGRNLTDAELNLAESAFSTAGLPDYQRVGNRLQVPTKLRNDYMKALAENKAFPKQLGSTVEQALASSSFLESLEVGRQRIRDARQRDIATAINSLSFVENAFLTYDSARNGFSSDMIQTASVFVMPKFGAPLTDDQKRSIMHGVAAGFAGLKYENIAVTDLSSGATMQGGNDPMTAEQQKYYQVKTRLENEYKTKARSLLADYGDSRVEAYVDLSTTLREATEILTYNEKPTTVQTNVSRKDSDSSKPATAGRPGAEPNAISNRSTSLQEYAEEKHKSKESIEAERSVVGHETTLIDKTGLTLKHVSLSVAIPASYYKLAFQRQWLDNNPDKTNADLATIDKTIFVNGVTLIKEEINKKIQRMLVGILPSEVAGADRFPSVTVTDYLDNAPEPFIEAGLAEVALAAMIGNWQWFGLFALAIVALLSLRSFAKGPASGNADEQFERGFNIQLEDPSTWDLSGQDDDANEFSDRADAAENSGTTRKFNATGNNVREELTSMVRENPDAAASLLRSWIGDAA